MLGVDAQMPTGITTATLILRSPNQLRAMAGPMSTPAAVRSVAGAFSCAVVRYRSRQGGTGPAFAFGSWSRVVPNRRRVGHATARQTLHTRFIKTQHRRGTLDVWKGGVTMGFWMGGMWGGMLFGAVMWLLILVGVGFLIYALVQRWGDPKGRMPAEADQPLAIARIRYSRGEITRDEFLQLQRDLDSKGGAE